MKTTIDTTESSLPLAATPLFAQVWVRGKYEPRQVCCSDMALAFTSGTDNEAYGKLASAYGDDPSSIRFGCELPAVKFCPWCGTETRSLDWANAASEAP